MASADVFPEIKKYQADLERCMRCGFCAFWCPIYQEERVEASMTRGKNVMLRSLLEGGLEMTGELADRLSKCLLCMTCSANCPARCDTPSAVIAGRAENVNNRGLAWPSRAVYRWLLPHRRLFGNSVRLASRLQGLLLPRTEGSIRHLSLFLSALGKGRHIPEIAPRFLRQILPEVNSPPPGTATRLRVGYFTGCMTEFVFPEVGKKTVDFLTRHGVEVVIPRAQGCCGAPVFLGAGDFVTGRRMADSLAKTFADFDYVVSDCPTCVSAIKDYRKFLADTPERQAAYNTLNEKIKDITQFMVDVLALPAAAYRAAAVAKGTKITWHDPCHLNRHLGIKSQPRHIMTSIPGIEYIEMPAADRCCGLSGGFSIAHYDLSRKIGDKKIDAVAATGADIVVTSCPGCRIQLIDGLKRHSMPQKVMHIMELLE
ncbi:MAG: (Fe-S)-binding protein [Chloroflexi bacterium]|nr:(Fe-S)-binding protein [Chloroflexota bacterium]